MDDLVDLNFGNPAPPQRTAASLDPWGGGGNAPAAADPWGAAAAPAAADPWGGNSGGAAAGFNTSPSRGQPTVAVAQDPWGGQPQNNQGGCWQ